MNKDERSLPPERCGDVTVLNEILDRIEAHPIVNGRVAFECKHNKGTGRLLVKVWCRREHLVKPFQVPNVCLNQKRPDDPAAVPDYQVAAQK